MKKSTSKIREDIARLQEQLRQTETTEATRVGRLALKAGLLEVGMDEAELLAGFEEMAQRFRSRQKTGQDRSTGASSRDAPEA